MTNSKNLSTSDRAVLVNLINDRTAIEGAMKVLSSYGQFVHADKLADFLQEIESDIDQVWDRTK